MKRREIVDITRQDFGATPLSTAHYVFRIRIYNNKVFDKKESSS